MSSSLSSPAPQSWCRARALLASLPEFKRNLLCSSSARFAQIGARRIVRLAPLKLTLNCCRLPASQLVRCKSSRSGRRGAPRRRKERARARELVRLRGNRSRRPAARKLRRRDCDGGAKRSGAPANRLARPLQAGGRAGDPCPSWCAPYCTPPGALFAPKRRRCARRALARSLAPAGDVRKCNRLAGNCAKALVAIC